jgi:hypothetical protein
MSALFDGKISSGYAAEVRAAVAGFHSILSISLDALSLAQNPTITFHETLHERILMRTPDGFTHLRLKHLSVTPTVSEETRTWARSWCREIERNSAVAHESIATYCAIKQSDLHEHQSAIEALSPPYRAWYQSLANLIDPVFPASYVQYLIGWFIAELCFSTSLPERIASVDLDTAIALENQERPNWRLERILERLTAEAMTGLLGAVQASTTTDIQREEVWESVPIPVRKELDGKLSKVIRGWGARQDFGVDTAAAYGDWRQITGKVADRLDVLEGSVMPLPPLTHADAEAGRLTETRLINRRMARPNLPAAVSDEQLDKLAIGGPQPLLVASATFAGDCETRQWIVALEGREEVSHGVIAGGSTSTEGLWRLLDARRREITAGRAPRPFSTFLVGVRTPREFAEHMGCFLAHMCDPARTRPVETYGWGRLMWYMSGDYIELLRVTGGASDHIAFLGVPLSLTATGELGVGQAPGANRKFDLVLHFAHATKLGIETRLIRIFNPLASGYAMQAEDKIVSQGKGTRRKLDEFGDDARMQLARIAGLVTALWPEY